MKTICIAFFKVEDKKLLDDFEKMYQGYLQKAEERNRKNNSLLGSLLFQQKHFSIEEKEYFATINHFEQKLKKPLGKLMQKGYFEQYQIEDVYPAYTLLRYLKNNEYDLYPTSLIDFDCTYHTDEDLGANEKWQQYLMQKLEENKNKAMVAVIKLKI